MREEAVPADVVVGWFRTEPRKREREITMLEMLEIADREAAQVVKARTTLVH